MQKITPFLWYDDNAEEAMSTYVSLIADSEILDVSHPSEGAPAFMVTARLAGLEVMAMNGGPDHPITPSFSFFVGCESVEQIDALWAALSEGGFALMPLGAYPFGERYGWVQDRFGLSWQLMLTNEPQTVTPMLMFVGDQFGRAEEAITLYTSIFDDSGIEVIVRDESDPAVTGPVIHSRFTLAGVRFMAMESNLEHNFTFTDGTSLFVRCESQQEVDDLWRRLTADGGEESMCGWLIDRFGVSWQIIPNRLMELMGDEDREKAGRVTQAMLKMQKIDVAALDAVYAGSGVV